MCACICKCVCAHVLDSAVRQMWHDARHVQRRWASQLLSSKPWPLPSCAFITTWQTSRHSLQDFWGKKKTPNQPRAAKPAPHIFLISTHWIIYSWNQNPDTMQKMEVDLIRGEKEILLLSTFAFIRKQVVVRSMEHLFELWYESPEAATTRKKHSQVWQSHGGLL